MFDTKSLSSEGASFFCSSSIIEITARCPEYIPLRNAWSKAVAGTGVEFFHQGFGIGLLLALHGIPSDRFEIFSFICAVISINRRSAAAWSL